MATELHISNVSKTFGRKKVVDNISFDVRSGEVFGFLGPNGAGKTTTIKMVTGFLTLDEGSITINGYDHIKNYEKAMGCLGGIVENPEMYKDISGRVNLEMYARLHKGVTRERIEEVVALVGMQERINDTVKKYSLGMKQRIGLAQALLHRPKILILDEPTNGLDPAGIRELRDILKKLAHEENVAVMVSSHLLSEMQLMCDRVGIINKGRLIDVKTIDELTTLASGAVIYRILTSQTEKAAAILRTVYPDQIREISADFLDIEINKPIVPAAITLLAVNGIEIFGAAKLETSLEDAFLQITGGGLTIE
jgi:ABC-2 type transport system ATP-binding protein